MNRPPSPAAPPLEGYLGYYAGFVSRLLAEAVDVILISFSFVSLTWFLSVTATMLQLRNILGFSLGQLEGYETFTNLLFGPASAAFFSSLYVVFYHVFFWSFTGQTPGKALLGLRVVTLTGQRLPPFRALLRFLGYVVSGVPLYLGFLWMLWDDQRQGWHDKISGSYVVYTWAARPDEEFLVDQIQEVTGTHEPPALPANTETK